MKAALIQLSKGVQAGPAADLVPVLFGETSSAISKKPVPVSLFNKNLDHSQVFSPLSVYGTTLISQTLFGKVMDGSVARVIG